MKGELLINIPFLGNFLRATFVTHHDKNSVLYGHHYEFFVLDTQSLSARHCYLTSIIILLHACVCYILLSGQGCGSQPGVFPSHLRVSDSVALGGVHRLALLPLSL